MLRIVAIVTARMQRKLNKYLLTQRFGDINPPRSGNFHGHNRVIQPDRLDERVQRTDANKAKWRFKPPANHQLGTKPLDMNVENQRPRRLGIASR